MPIKGQTETVEMFRAARRALSTGNIQQVVLIPGADILAQRIRANAPVGTGRRWDGGPRVHLRDTVRIVIDRTGAVLVKVFSQAAHLVEFGTNPHEIKPGRKNGVLFLVPYRAFRRFVRKARAPAHPFIRPAVMQTQSTIIQLSQRYARILVESGLRPWRKG